MIPSDRTTLALAKQESRAALLRRARRAFERRYGGPARLVVRAPGRVNLIGEHTDYNDGFVLPMAIDRAVWIALRPTQDRRLTLRSLDLEQEATLDLDALPQDARGWEAYLAGVAGALQAAGHELQGLEGVLASDVPIGAGLSSSAALELAVARAFAEVSELRWDPRSMARVGQAAEHRWVGVQCGIMDQLVSAAGVAGHALLIDCRSLDVRPVPLPAGLAVVILDTATRRGLESSAYNERRAACEAVARHFGVRALRDLDGDALDAARDELDAIAYRRARHVVTECRRTLEAARAMADADGDRLGALLDEGHRSLRDDFEVSSPALDAMVRVARAAPGCLGARMTGAGFGGCAVALVRAREVASFVERTAQDYAAQTGRTPAVYVCEATDGAAPVDERCRQGEAR